MQFTTIWKLVVCSMSIMSSLHLGGAYLVRNGYKGWENVESLSKTTKLLLLDSLLQEVCIESGSDGSLALSSLGLSVCLVSHNLLYSGLKKAHSKMKSMKKNKNALYDFHVNSGAVALSVPPEWVKQPDDGHQGAKGCLQQPVFPGGHPSKYYQDSTLLNFSDQTRTGVLKVHIKVFFHSHN